MSETPTEPADYALVSLGFGSVLALTAATAGRREPIPGRELPALAAAAFALSKLIVSEKAESWVREPFLDEDGERRPKGRGLRYAVGELLMCTRCTGAWSALALVGLRLHAPAAGRAVTSVLATSAGNDFAHAAFSWLCARATTQDAEAAAGRRAA